MLSIRRSDVPCYLRESEFYLSLSEEDEGDISVPEDCFKFSDVVTDDHDLRLLLSTLRFWVTEQIPKGLVYFVLSDSGNTFCQVFSEFSKELKYLPFLVTLGLTGENLRLSLTAGQGNAQILRYLLNNGYETNMISAIFTARNGHLDCLQMLHEAGIELLNPTICTDAAHSGHLDCLIYAHEHGCPFAANIASKAACSGHLDCLRYVHTHGCSWSPSVAFHAAASGNLDCLKYVFGTFVADEEFFASVSLLDAKIVHSGSVECLRYAHEAGMQWSADIATTAVLTNQLECLQYLIEHGCIVPDGLIRQATTIECLKYLHSAGCAFNNQVSRTFALRGIEMLRFAHEHDCPWDERTYLCLLDAPKVDMECFMYAHEHGCPWSVMLTNKAVRTNSVKVLKYLHRHNCPGADSDIIRYICEEESDDDSAVMTES